MKLEMKSKLFICLAFSVLSAAGQDNLNYLKANAVRISDPKILSDSVYNLLSGYQVIMFGEMHGTNESAQIVNGLTNLYTRKGDSVFVGLEIPPELMSRYTALGTDSSIYQSDFFRSPPYLDGRESFAWANLISVLNKNSKVRVFFFDINSGEDKNSDRDFVMASKIKKQFESRPKWKMITLSGNYHNRISNPASMTSVLKRNFNANVCSLNMDYKEGTCMADFGKGIQKKELGSYPSVFNSTEGYEKYFLLYPKNSTFDFDGFYFTRHITAAKMVSTP